MGEIEVFPEFIFRDESNPWRIDIIPAGLEKPEP